MTDPVPNLFPALTTMLKASSVLPLITAATSTITSAVVFTGASPKTISVSVTGTGAVTANISFYGNNINSTTNGTLLGTASLSGTTTDSAGLYIPANWPYVFATITTLTGTSATVNATVGV